MMSAMPGTSGVQIPFSKPKPATTPVKTTSILAKAHVPSAGFAPSDTGNLQVGMEVGNTSDLAMAK